MAIDQNNFRKLFLAGNYLNRRTESRLKSFTLCFSSAVNRTERLGLLFEHSRIEVAMMLHKGITEVNWVTFFKLGIFSKFIFWALGRMADGRADGRKVGRAGGRTWWT